jgi:hypothetical protein
MALATAATGYSMMGDRDQVDRFHDQMARAIDDADDDWAWGNAIHIPGYVDARRATCYERLGAGAALEATTLFETAIGRQRSTHHRDGGVFRARQARAFLSGGEPAEAARCAVEAIAVLDQTSSATLKHELVDLRRAARIWRDTSDGQELVAVLDEVA